MPGRHAEDVSRDWHTAPVSVRLATPAAVRACLRHLGFEWKPVPAAASTLTVEPILYAWVAGGDAKGMDPLYGGVLYWGIGQGVKGGTERLKYEGANLFTQEWTHGHGMGNQRLGAAPVIGTVTRIEGADLGWMHEHLAFRDPEGAPGSTMEAAKQAILAGHTLPTAERLAIRAAMHLGDTGAPIQSMHAGAWAPTPNAAPFDNAAYAAARHILGGRGVTQ
jgi:hypothetical protein